MNQFTGCWVEQMDNGKWAICWPDCSYLETGFGSKGAATAALNRYLRAIWIPKQKRMSRNERPKHRDYP